jgi:S1-C subfamily serine protease
MAQHSRLARAALIVLTLVLSLAASAPVAAQVDPAIRDRVVSAAVQIAITADVTENGTTSPQFFPVGSGTIISPDGLVLTNWHVIDMKAHRDRFAQWEQEAAASGTSLAIKLEERGVMILTSPDGGVPEPAFLAEIVAQDEGLDLAVLHVIAALDGAAANPNVPTLPYIAIGDSDAVSLADPIDIYSYPQAGGGSLTYTTGVVSGFNFEQDTKHRAWITTDATLSGGSSGGTAVNRRGQLVGVPTQGSALDCRPFDANNDGMLDSRDVGCIPVGGSIGQIRPINLAWPLLEAAGMTLGTPPAAASTDEPAATTGLSKSGFPKVPGPAD